MGYLFNHVFEYSFVGLHVAMALLNTVDQSESIKLHALFSWMRGVAVGWQARRTEMAHTDTLTSLPRATDSTTRKPCFLSLVAA